MSDIELRLFRYFVALAEERHFARAALRLKITPPTLTHQIKKLESELGVKLALRKGNTLVTLTDAGQRASGLRSRIFSPVFRHPDVLGAIAGAACVHLAAMRRASKGDGPKVIEPRSHLYRFARLG
jgi:DNA-binding transcriptional ArsR family regulator